MPYIIKRVNTIPDDTEIPAHSIGNLLKDFFEKYNEPYVSEKIEWPVPMFHDCAIKTNEGAEIAHTYMDQYGNEGVIVLDEAYDSEVVRLITNFETANPEVGILAVQLA